MRDRAGFAVHCARRADDAAAEGLSDRLMAETDAEKWPPRCGAGIDEPERYSRLIRRAGTR